MVKKSIAILLILLTGVLPVVSAHANCAGFGGSEIDHLSADSAAVGVDIVNQIARDMPTSISMDKHSGSGCHSNGSCVFHLCSAYGLTTSTDLYSSFPSKTQALLANASVKGLILPPETKPPIRIL